MGQTTTQTYSGVIDRDVAMEILLVQEANAYPIYAMLQGAGRTRPTKARKFEWQTDAFAARRTAIDNGGGAYTAGTTSLVVDDASVFYPNSMLYAEATGEVMIVTATDAGTETITVIRGIGSVAAHADAVANNANLLNIGSAEGEGKLPPSARVTTKANVSNYIQLFRHSVDISGTMQRVETFVEDERAYQRKLKYEEHLRDLEHMLIFGGASGDKTDAAGKPMSTSGGLLQAVTTHVDNIGGAMSQGEVDAHWEKAFSQGADQKFTFAGSTAVLALNGLYGKNVQNATTDLVVGLRFKQILTPFGVVNLVHNRRFGEAHKGTMITVDVPKCGLRPTNGGETRLKPDVEPKGTDGIIDEWFSELGFEWGDEKNHAVAKGITGFE